MEAANLAIFLKFGNANKLFVLSLQKMGGNETGKDRGPGAKLAGFKTATALQGHPRSIIFILFERGMPLPALSLTVS